MERLNYNEIADKMTDGILCNRYPMTFIDERIDPSTIPEGMYLYEVAGDDECGDIPSYIGKNIKVNFYGSIVLGCELELNSDGFLDLDDKMNTFLLLDETALQELFTDLFGDNSGIIPFVQEIDDDGNVVGEHILSVKDLLTMSTDEEK